MNWNRTVCLVGRNRWSSKRSLCGHLSLNLVLTLTLLLVRKDAGRGYFGP